MSSFLRRLNNFPYLFIFILGCFCDATFSAETKAMIEVHGHRGARGHFPENSLPAFQYALESGVDYLEFDLGVTKDRVVIVSHNSEIDPSLCLSKGAKKIEGLILLKDLNLEEVQSFDCGSLKQERFPKQKLIANTKMPTLEEVISLINKSSLPSAQNVQINIEIKSDPLHPEWTVPIDEFAKKVLDVVNKYSFAHRTVIQSFDERALRAVRNLDSKIRTSYLSDESFSEDHFKRALDLKVNIYSPNLWKFTKYDAKKIQKKGLRVLPWTANSEFEWDYLLNRGVDGIISDYPAELIAHLKRKKLR